MLRWWVELIPPIRLTRFFRAPKPQLTAPMRMWSDGQHCYRPADALLQSTVTKDHSTDAVVRATEAGGHQTDAVLQATEIVGHSADAVLHAQQLR